MEDDPRDRQLRWLERVRLQQKAWPEDPEWKVSSAPKDSKASNCSGINGGYDCGYNGVHSGGCGRGKRAAER